MEVTARPGEIAARVTNAGGTPVVGAYAMITRGPAHNDIAAETDAGGRFLFGDLTPGDYALLVNAEGHNPKEVQTRVGAGETVRLDVVLRNP